MSNVWIVGSAGMLGKAVLDESRRRHHTINQDMAEFFGNFKKDDVILNCAGAIPIGKRQNHEMVYSNAVLPFILAEECKNIGAKLIHVSTDCVFRGHIIGSHSINSIPDARDLYGASKALGEFVTELDATVVRTSFIGFKHGLLKWFLDKAKNKESVEGYSLAFWSGSTVWEVARGLLDMVEMKNLKPIEHLSTRLSWSKYDVLCQIRELFDLDIEISKTDIPVKDMTLVPTIEIRDLNDRFVASELFEKYMSG